MKDGSIKDASLLRGFNEACDNEALRVVAAMPNWIPGKQRGKAVNVQFNLPIRFNLDNKELGLKTGLNDFQLLFAPNPKG